MPHQAKLFEELPAALLQGFQLAAWQQEAVDAWTIDSRSSPFEGTMEIFTGGGKTLIALACFERALQEDAETRLAVVVPTEALALQWIESVTKHTVIPSSEVGLLGAGKQDQLTGNRVLVSILNTARKRLPEMAKSVPSLMLVVDECHRAGSPMNQRVLDTPARFRLGLSATPDREELDDYGQPIDYDEHVLGQKLGEVCFRFSLRDAREAGWLPEYRLTHHAITLTPDERTRYESLSTRIDELTDELRAHGVNRAQIMQLKTDNEEARALAQSWKALTTQRKDLLFRANERSRIAAILVQESVQSDRSARILLFNERIQEAANLWEQLQQSLPELDIGLEHSKLPSKQRNSVLDSFRAGRRSILVSVKALVEGLDVPEIDVAISVAATSSVRQRIQSLGRALRRRFDSDTVDVRQIHLLYVHESADEEIYGREDWSDLTGRGTNTYLHWPLGEDRPEPLPGPPRTPKPSEEQEWDRLGRQISDAPAEWLGSWPEDEYHVDTLGNVTNSSGLPIANPQNVDEMVAKVKGRGGGRFFLTPSYRLILVSGEGPERSRRLYVAGQLQDRLRVEEERQAALVDASELAPGDDYQGATDELNGSFWISQKKKGMVERRPGPGIKEFANDTDVELGENARRIIHAWRQTGHDTHKFSVNNKWHAWYRKGGKVKFLAEVPGGFAWPTESEGG